MGKDSPKKWNGISAAAEMLSGLDSEGQKKVIELMTEKDPSLTERIQEKMLGIDDLKSMSTGMIQDLFRKVKLENFAIALKLATQETREFFYSKVSRSMQEDIKHTIEIKKMKRSEVEKVHREVMEEIRKMVADGEIVLGKSGDEYV